MARARPRHTVDPPSAPGGIPMFETIVVGVDDREGGRDALALAALLAEVTGADLVAVRAYPHETHPSRAAVGRFEEDMRTDAGTELETVLAETGVSARRVIAGDSSAARALHHAADHEGAGLLVVGSTHRGHVGQVLVGGVSASVLHHAPCPVAVAPRGFADRHDSLSRIGVGFDGGEESQTALVLAGELAKMSGARLEILSVVATAVPAAYPAAYEHDWVDRADEAGR